MINDITSLKTKSYCKTSIFSTNTVNRSRRRWTTKILQPNLVMIFIRSIANKAKIRRCFDCTMMVKVFRSTDMATPSVQSIVDGFRMEKAINQSCRLCSPQSPASLSPCESSNRIYSSVSVIETSDTEERIRSSLFEQCCHETDNNDEDGDVYVCGGNAHDHYRLGKTRTAHDSVFS